MRNMKGTKTKIGRLTLVGISVIAVFLVSSIPDASSQVTTEIVVPDGYEAEILATSDPGFLFWDITFSPIGELIVSVAAQSRVPCDSYIASISPDGVVSRFADICIDNPNPVAFGPYTGSLLFFAEVGGFWDYVYTVPAGGTPDDVQLFASGFVVPLDLAFSPDGDLYLADVYSGTIYKINPEGEVSPFVSGFTVDTSGYPNLTKNWFGIAFDPEGVLFVADGGAGTVYMVSADGVISTFASGFNSPTALAFSPNGDLFVADSVAGTVYSISSDGVISPFASGFKHPLSLAFDPDDALYVVEWESFEQFWPPTRIIKISRSAAQSIQIDIKPGSWPNAVNPDRKGVIPVAILTTDKFDAITVDPLSVKFGLGEATEAHGKGHIEDVDGDGDLDMVLHFKTQETGIKAGDTKACLTGKTVDGKSIKGCDAIVTVPKGKGKPAPALLIFSLGPSFPNPPNPEAWIPYTLGKDVEVTITIYSSSGRVVRILKLGHQKAGAYISKSRAAYWDGRNEYGERVSSGIYFYAIKAGEFMVTRKMVVVR